MNEEDEKLLHPTIASRAVTQHILKAFGLHASKKLGQNFLIDAGIVRGIVEAAEVQPGDRVLEIGPGIGTLTQGLAEAGADVSAVELDKKLRNNGFMKGPEYIVEDPGSAITNRMQEKSTRRIIVREYMSADEVYYLRFKTVQDLLSKQLFLDYIEWCPKEVYDNPETPEDVW